MADGVAEVENAAQALLRLVDLDDPLLDPARRGDDPFQDGGVSSLQGPGVVLERRQQIRVLDDAVFHDLGQTACEFPLRESLEKRQVDEDGLRLVKRPQQVLPRPGVHAGLAPDGAVHLREQRRGDLHEGKPPHVNRGEKARHVPDHAAAQGDQARGPVGIPFQEIFGKPQAGRNGLGPLAGRDRQHPGPEPRPGQRGEHAPAVQPRDGIVADDEPARRPVALGEDQRHAVQDAVPDVNVVARAQAPVKVHADPVHDGALSIRCMAADSTERSSMSW